jgi:hypothetical protein
VSGAEHTINGRAGYDRRMADLPAWRKNERMKEGKNERTNGTRLSEKENERQKD